MPEPLSATERVRKRRRRLLKGCAITAGIIIVLALVVWLVATHYLGALLSNLVREQASASLNGRLEFSSLDVDLGGHAVMRDARIIPEGEDEAVISCPRVVVSFDFLTFIGPNRGKRAVVINLKQPWVSLVREQDGGFNLAHLLKEREEEGEPIGLSVRVQDATIDFTDRCLLAQGYPRIDSESGLLADLLAELGYDKLGPAAAAPHTETLKADGSFNANPGRNELSFGATIERSGQGSFSVRGSGDTTFARFELDIKAQSVEFASLAAYIHSAFPEVQLGQAGDGPLYEEGPPYLSGGLNSAALTLAKQREQPVVWSLTADCMESRLVSASLPDLRFPRLEVAWRPQQDSASADLQLITPGLELSGRPKLDLASERISGELSVSAADLAGLAAELGYAEVPLDGSATATVSLGGTTGAPEIALEFTGGTLAAAGIDLGTPSGSVALSTGEVSLERVRTTGGELDLTANGSYSFEGQSGRLEVAAEALGVQRLISLIQEDGAQPPELLRDAAGQVQLAAVLRIEDGTARGTLRAWSARISAAGYTLEEVEAEGTLDAPTVELEQVTGTLVTGTPVDSLGFTTDGPLKAGFRIGGSVSYMEDSPLVLALIGTANTKNLNPEQADVSFKAVGPVNDPELRFQLKTRHADNPLVLTAAGHYRKGMAPFTARLTWAETDIDLKGDIDLPGQKIDAKLSATNVRLQQFVDDERIYGKGSVTASVKGSFDEPELAGALSLPSLQFRLPEKTYEISDAGCGFKIVGSEAASISNGKLTFNGQPFTFAGTLGRERGSITLEAAQFDLFSALAAIPVGEGVGPQRLQIESAGSFRAVISGEVTDPLAEVSYDSGPGSVEGHAFNSASLRANLTRDGVEMGRLEVISSSGRASVSGRVGFGPLVYDGTIEVEEFDVGILTPIIAPDALASLTGNLNGLMSVSGNPDGYSANGNLRLTGGSLKGIPIELAEATLRTSGNRLVVEKLHAKSAGGTADADGSITFDPLQIEGNVDARGFNVTLLSSFFDNKILGSLEGKLDGRMSVSGNPDGYSANGNLRLTGGSLRGIPIELAEATLRTSGNRLIVEKLRAESAGGTADADGSVTFDPLQIEGNVDARGFNVSLLSSFFDNELLNSLEGSLRTEDAQGAKFSYSAASGSYSAEGTISLTAGSFQGVPIDSATARLSKSSGALKIEEARITMQGSTLTARGSIGSGWKETDISLESDSVNLAVLLPFLPDEVPDLSGTISIDAQVSPGDGEYPEVELALSDTGQGLSAGPAQFSSVDVKVKLDHEMLRIEKCDLAVGGNTLSIGGSWPLDQGNPRLNLWASAQDFQLQDVGGLLPPGVAELLPAGSLDFERLELTGTLQSPKLTGDVEFKLTAMPPVVDLNVTEINGTIGLTENDFNLDEALAVTEFGGERSTIRLSGSGSVSLRPLALVSDGITVQLAPAGKPARVRYSGPLSFDGYLGGTVYVLAPTGNNERIQITGNVTIGDQGLSSTIWLPAPQEPTGESTEGMDIELNDLKLFAATGTKVRYSPIDLQAEGTTGDGHLTISGVPGRDSGDENRPYADELKICGNAYITKGSMFLYFIGHTVRFEGDTNTLRFPCEPGKLTPYLTGTAATILPRVLQGETIETTPGMPGDRRTQRGDLKVNLGFNNILLGYLSGGDSSDEDENERDDAFRDLREIQLTSEPPRSRQQILSYFAGGFSDLAAGRTEITEFAESQLYTAGTGFISRALETAFNLDAFRLGGTGSEDNPFYLDVEKDVSDKLTFSYYRDFFNQTGQTEEFGLRYNLLRGPYDGTFQNLDLSVNFAEGGFTGPEREFMFEWNVRF